MLRYRPNFGKLGGSFSAKAVQIWLDGVIRQQLMGMLIWPQRLVIPMFDEKITGPLDRLYLQYVCVGGCATSGNVLVIAFGYAFVYAESVLYMCCCYYKAYNHPTPPISIPATWVHSRWRSSKALV